MTKRADGELIDAFNVAAQELERSMKELRATKPTDEHDATEDTRRERLTAARAHLEELERKVAELAKMRDGEAANAEEWERRAMAAVQQGKDGLALESLQRQKEHLALRGIFSREHDTTARIVEVMREALDELSA